MELFGASSVINYKSNIHYGVVQKVLPSNVLQVKIIGIDREDSSENLIKCIPLLPLFLNITPKPNDGVLILQKDNNPKGERFWIGPLHSREDRISDEDAESAKSILAAGPTNTGEDIRGLKGVKGLYSNDNEVAIQGKGSGDLIFKEDETVLRINKFDGDNKLKFNNTNIGYLQLKNPIELVKDTVEKEVIEIISSPPEFTIDVLIRGLSSDGSITTEDDSLAEEYQIFIRKIDNKKRVTVNLSNSELTLSDAKAYAIEQIGIITGGAEKWQLLTESSSLQEQYPSNYNFSDTEEIKKKVKTQTTKGIKKSKDSIINVVADRINLISYDGEHAYNLTNNGELINNDTQKDIQETAQSMVYGEKLVEFLGLVKDYVTSHVHAYHGVTSDPEESKNNLLGFELETILNKNIKTH
jgi:hypothetical protein